MVPQMVTYIPWGLKEQTLNSALAFNAEEYIELPDGPVLRAPFTQEAWIYPDLRRGRMDWNHGQRTRARRFPASALNLVASAES